MASSAHGPLGNRLLDAMPAHIIERLHPHLESIALPVGQPIHKAGAAVEHALFPTRGLISMIATMSDGASVEIGMVGREGMFSAATILGDDNPPHGAMVQLGGAALQLDVQYLHREMEDHPPVRTRLLRYAQATMATAAQSAACNRLHLLEQRFARWLLLAHDRAGNDTFPMTHEFLSMMLGVRRSGVTVAAQALQISGMISYHHGSMTILDRTGLEAVSCECYRLIEDEFARLMAPGA